MAKNSLLECLATGFETGALEITHDLPLGEQLRQEVASFELETTTAGNLILTGGGMGHQADLAIALALAWFASDRLGNWVTGEVKRTGWY